MSGDRIGESPPSESPPHSGRAITSSKRVMRTDLVVEPGDLIHQFNDGLVFVSVPIKEEAPIRPLRVRPGPRVVLRAEAEGGRLLFGRRTEIFFAYAGLTNLTPCSWSRDKSPVILCRGQAA